LRENEPDKEEKEKRRGKNEIRVLFSFGNFKGRFFKGRKVNKSQYNR
jgi:hypothetical protein